MWLCSQRHLKPHERFFSPNFPYYQTDSFLGKKDSNAVAIRKGIPHNHVDIPPLVSAEATGVCIPIGNFKLLLVTCDTCRDVDIIYLLRFRNKSVLAGCLNAKHPVWNSAVSNPSGKKLLDLFDVTDCEISALQCSTHYSPDRNSDILDTVDHHNVRLSEVIVCDVLDSDHLPIVFHILDLLKQEIFQIKSKIQIWIGFIVYPLI
jgi:hypothetical protein